MDDIFSNSGKRVLRPTASSKEISFVLTGNVLSSLLQERMAERQARVQTDNNSLRFIFSKFEHKYTKFTPVLLIIFVEIASFSEMKRIFKKIENFLADSKIMTTFAIPFGKTAKTRNGRLVSSVGRAQHF